MASPIRILITGATGFVGRHLIAALSASSTAFDIIAGLHGSDATDGLNARVVPLDVTDPEQTLAVIEAEQPTHIMHLAGIAAVAEANLHVRKTWEVNTQGTLNVALGIRQGSPESRLVFCSSALIYGSSFHSGEAMTEHAALDPVNIYGSSKAAADLLIGQLAKDGLRAIRLRPFNHTGPGQSSNMVVPSFASQIAAIERGEREPVLRVGNLTVRRDFLDVRDVVDAYVRSVLRFDSLPNGAIFNIASGNVIAVDAILNMLLSMSSKKIEVVPDLQRMRPNDMPIMAGNADKIRRALEWAPRLTMADTLKSVLDYHRGL